MQSKDLLLQMKESAELDVKTLENEIRQAKARIGAFEEAAKALGPEAAEGPTAGVVRKLQEKVRKGQAELTVLEEKVLDAQGRAEAFEETLKLFAKEGEEPELRTGTAIYRVREALRANGKPMNLTEILKAMGAEGDEKMKTSLRGSLASYANKGRVFTKEEQAETFGLLEFRSEVGAKVEK